MEAAKGMIQLDFSLARYASQFPSTNSGFAELTEEIAALKRAVQLSHLAFTSSYYPAENHNPKLIKFPKSHKI